MKTRAFLFAVLLCGCADVPSNVPPSTVDHPGTEEDVNLAAKVSCDASTCLLTIDYEPSASLARVAELRIAHSENLVFTNATAGNALEAAQKELIAQTREPGVVRLVAFAASNTATIDRGTLATVAFERTSDATARLEILTDKPLFAPAEAGQGLKVSDPLEF